MEEFLFGYGRKSKCICKYQIKIEQGNRGNQEIGLVYVSEVHGCDTSAFWLVNRLNLFVFAYGGV
jgi:hypothetical protein